MQTIIIIMQTTIIVDNRKGIIPTGCGIIKEEIEQAEIRGTIKIIK
jgi:hypothetical protein